MECENSKAVPIPINYQKIEEIREGLKTDAWINSEENLDDMLNKAQIAQGQALWYFSIICKSNQRILPGETKDFVTTEEELAKTLREIDSKLKDLRPKNVPEEDCLFDSSLTHDMKQPISHYFIASSHNTYLTGHQMTSKSSYEIYRNILLDGCRCIEIDIWEGKTDPFDPVVTHKFTSFLKLTSTSEILLRKVLEVINEYAFFEFKCPLILSIENHLEKENRIKLAKMLYDAFDDKLYFDNIGAKFPLLSDMENRIFIKDHKKLRKEPEFKGTVDQTVKVDSSHCVDGFGHSTIETSGDLDSDDDYDYDDWDTDEDDDLDDEIRDQQEEIHSQFNDGLNCFKKASVEPLESVYLNYKGPTYPQMINYFEAKRFKDIETCIKKFKFNQMFSQKETKSLKILDQRSESGENKYRQFTRTNVARVYPRSTRQNSSNYNPVRHWNAGVQMVALNYQTASVEMKINWAQFALNGGCGYVLKPEYLRTQEENKPPRPNRPAGIDLQIEIVRGEFANLFPVNMKIELKVTTRVYCPDTSKHTNGKDLKREVLKRDQYEKVPMETKIIAGNGINPVWKDSSSPPIEYRLSHSELSFVLFSLMNGTDNTVGEYMIAVQAMRTGELRSIDLYDDKMNKIPGAKIYVQVSKMTDS